MNYIIPEPQGFISDKGHRHGGQGLFQFISSSCMFFSNTVTVLDWTDYTTESTGNIIIIGAKILAEQNKTSNRKNIIYQENLKDLNGPKTHSKMLPDK